MSVLRPVYSFWKGWISRRRKHRHVIMSKSWIIEFFPQIKAPMSSIMLCHHTAGPQAGEEGHGVFALLGGPPALLPPALLRGQGMFVRSGMGVGTPIDWVGERPVCGVVCVLHASRFPPALLIGVVSMSHCTRTNLSIAPPLYTHTSAHWIAHTYWSISLPLIKYKHRCRRWWRWRGRRWSRGSAWWWACTARGRPRRRRRWKPWRYDTHASSLS